MGHTLSMLSLSECLSSFTPKCRLLLDLVKEQKEVTAAAKSKTGSGTEEETEGIDVIFGYLKSAQL